MSTQSVDRAADSTEVCRSLVFFMCGWIDWFESSRFIEELETNSKIRKILGP